MNPSIPSCIYGPVDSWRLGKSLGIDLLCIDSICSFECVYCQLGKINRVTMTRETFVSTSKVLQDLAESNWRDADVITFSGSGEPTLAKNLGEVITEIRKTTGKPVIVLTNSTLLDQPDVRKEISYADRIFCKLDAWTDDVLRRIDRPHKDISLKSVIEGIKLLRDEFHGFLAIQTMILRSPKDFELKRFANILKHLKPDEIQLNLPSRPIPEKYTLETRGNLTKAIEGSSTLRSVSKSELAQIGTKLTKLTGLPVIVR